MLRATALLAFITILHVAPAWAPHSDRRHLEASSRSSSKPKDELAAWRGLDAETAGACARRCDKSKVVSEVGQLQAHPAATAAARCQCWTEGLLKLYVGGCPDLRPPSKTPSTSLRLPPKMRCALRRSIVPR